MRRSLLPISLLLLLAGCSKLDEISGPPPPPEVLSVVVEPVDAITAGDSAEIQVTVRGAQLVLLLPPGDTLLTSDSPVDSTEIRRWVKPTHTTDYLVVAEGLGGTAYASVTVVVTGSGAPKPAVTITASPAGPVAPGTPVRLTVTMTDADRTLVVPPGIVLPGGGLGTTVTVDTTVIPRHTTTYLVIAEGPGGTTHETVTVVVDGLPGPTASLTATPSVLPAPGTVTLTATIEHADSAVLLPTGTVIAGNGGAPVTQTIPVSLSHTTTYLLVAYRAKAAAYAVATVQVDRPDTTLAPTASLTADRLTIPFGESVTLTATIQYADSALLVPPGAVLAGQAGAPTTHDVPVTPAHTTTYLLIAVGPGGTAFSAVTVEVEPPSKPTAMLTASPAGPVAPGAPVTLTANVTHATSAVLLPDGIPIPLVDGTAMNHAVPVTPHQTTTYLLVAEGAGGVAHAVVTVQVTGRDSALTADLEAMPDTTLSGGPVTLTVNVTHATSAMILPDRIPVPLDGNGNASTQFTVNPTHTTTYLLVAYGTASTAYDVATVQVIGPAPRRPTASLTADRMVIPFGESVTLTATVQYADSALLVPPDTVLDGQLGALTPHMVTVTPAATTTYLLIAVGPGGTAFSAVRVEVVPPPPPTVTVTASPMMVQPGEPVTITVTMTDADRALVVPPGIVLPGGPGTVTRTLTVTPRHTTTYLVIAEGPGGTTHETVTVTVEGGGPAPTASLTANPTVIPVPGTVTLTATIEHADSAVVLPTGTVIAGNGGALVTETIPVSLSHTTTYLLVAYGARTTAYAVATVQVAQPDTTLAPTANLTASALSIPAGESVTLTATIEHADSALLVPPGVVLAGQAGALTTHDVPVTPAHTTTYLLIAVGPGGTAFSAVRVEVVPPPMPTVTVTASPMTVRPGEEVTLTVTMTDADQALVVPPGIVLPGGPGMVTRTLTVTPRHTTTYLVIAEGPGGTTHKTVTVTVEGVPVDGPTAELDAEPDTIRAGDDVILSVSVTRADSAILLPDGVGIPLDVNGNADTQLTVTPAHTTTYLLVAYGAATTAYDVATVQVIGPPVQPPTASLTATADTILAGQSVTLTATIERADTGIVVPPGEGIPGNGGQRSTRSFAVTPAQTTTYLLIAVGPGGTAFSAVRVEVTVEPSPLVRDSIIRRWPSLPDSQVVIVDDNDGPCCRGATDSLLVASLVIPEHFADSGVTVSVEIERTGPSQADEAFAIGLFRPGNRADIEWIFGNRSCQVVPDDQTHVNEMPVFVTVGRAMFVDSPPVTRGFVARHAIRFGPSGDTATCYAPNDPSFATPNSVHVTALKLVFWREP